MIGHSKVVKSDDVRSESVANEDNHLKRTPSCGKATIRIFELWIASLLD